MLSDKKIIKLVIWLAVIFCLIGALVSYDLEQYKLNNTHNNNKTQDETNLVSINLKENIKNNVVIVTDRFVGKIEQNSKVIAISKDGSMYIVKNGTVLVSDMVISKNEDSNSIYRINDVKMSIN